jgi:hypothetical protein
MRGRWWLGAACLLALGLFSLPRCNVYTTDLLVTGEAGSSADSGAPPGDGVGWWSRPLGDGCYSAGAPTAADRPKPSSAPALPPIYLAIKSTRLGGSDKEGNRVATAWQDQGFDLDGTCTHSGTCPDDGGTPPESCKPVSAELPIDGNYCRDNTFGRLSFFANSVPEIGQKYGLNDDAFNCALCTGSYNYLIKISDYNGTPNDDNVRIDAYPSPGVEPDRYINADCSKSNWRDLYPCFSADMPWTVQESAVSGPKSGADLPPANTFDDKAYVRDGYLVVNLPPDTLFWFPGKRARATAYPLYLKKALVTGKLGKAQNGTWALSDGIIAGSATGEDLVRGFRLIGFCETDSNYEAVKSFLLKNLDILASGENRPDVPCDAVSLGVAFTASQASPGGLVPVEPLKECEQRDAGADAK